MINIHFVVERWKWSKEYGVWVSTEGRVKDKSKKDCRIFTSSRDRYLSVVTEAGMVTIHRLVMKTWKPRDDYASMTVDHLNHNCKDNRLANLEWVTERENLRRAEEDLVYSESNKKPKKSCPLWKGAVRGSYRGMVVDFGSVAEAANFLREEMKSCGRYPLEGQMEGISEAIYSGGRFFRFRWKGLPA